MNYKEIILNKLLDKFEKSKSYLQDTNRRIMLKVESIKQYNIQNYEEKMLFHEVVKDLKNKGIIDFKWVKFEEENIMEEIWLIKEKVDKAYEEVKRKNPKQSYTEILKLLNSVDFRQEWIQRFCDDMKEYMQKFQKENTLLPKEKARDIIKALQEIDKMQSLDKTATVLKRIFSIRCYNNSKYFEREIEKNLVRIVKKYYTNEDLNITELNDDELLAQIGIVRYPEILEFCGNMKCVLNGEELTFSDATLGSYINSYTVLNIDKVQLIDVKKVIFIENKTNYINYIENKKNDEFVIYHGGVYSPIKGEFFSKIYKAVKGKAQFYHWSDIDIGGFNIFTRLKNNIIEELIPFKMDVSTLIKYKDSWQNFNEDYKNRLQKLRSLDRYECFFDVIDFMLKNNVRLEQESII